MCSYTLLEMPQEIKFKDKNTGHKKFKYNWVRLIDNLQTDYKKQY